VRVDRENRTKRTGRKRHGLAPVASLRMLG
jgi:hypothetical protein